MLSEAQRKAKAQRKMDRNLNPHAEARVAMLVWGAEYSGQRGGSMDFWYGLPDSRKRQCVRWADLIFKAPRITPAGRTALEADDG